ncbi:MAG: histidine kinase N-terminal 7TM domain-containing protein [Clostridiales bacterium]|nr:histidine kinase N-terminal 7TM domain-containing protein [Clostridiales bacterium]
MAAAKRKSVAKLCLALGLLVLAGFFRQMDRLSAPLPSAACFLLTNLIYIGLAMAWGFSISRRTLHRDDRRWLLLGCAMAVLWLFLRAVKYRFFSDDAITRHLWYLYYVPQILAPLFSLFAALQLGRREGDALSRKWYLLFIPAVLLIGGVLTNDLHQLVFRAVPGAATLETDYTHGWMYYLAMTWIVGLLLATGIIVYRKCRVSESRRYAWIPLCVFLGGFALCALSFANIYTFHKMPECFCLTFAAFWESCLQVGLLPTNGHYRFFFSESTVAAQIVNGRGEPVYRAKNAPNLTPDQLEAAACESILLNADTRLQSAPVQDGRVYWLEDISKINRIQAQLAEINARLSEENELIQAENELKRQRAQIEEQNRLMDAMLSLVQPQLLAINRLLSDKSAQSLKHICILGAYVKRRVNLALICDKKMVVPVDELAHCIRESLTYLTQYGAVCALHQEGRGSVSSREAQTAYDFFEDCLEAALPSLSALMVRLECGERFSIRLMLEDAAGLPNVDQYRTLGKLTIDDADGALCATLSFDRGGERA